MRSSRRARTARRRTVTISGGWADRFDRAMHAVESGWADRRRCDPGGTHPRRRRRHSSWEGRTLATAGDPRQRSVTAHSNSIRNRQRCQDRRTAPLVAHRRGSSSSAVVSAGSPRPDLDRLFRGRGMSRSSSSAATTSSSQSAAVRGVLRRAGVRHWRSRSGRASAMRASSTATVEDCRRHASHCGAGGREGGFTSSATIMSWSRSAVPRINR